MIPLDHRDTGNRTDPYTEPNSCFSDSSDSLNLLNFTEFNESSVPFRENPNVIFVSVVKVPLR